MSTFELDNISHAAVSLETADTLLFAFYEEYLSDAEPTTLKFDAERRPGMISAKILAIMNALHDARLHIDAVDDPEGSPIVAAYLDKAKQLHTHIKGA